MPSGSEHHPLHAGHILSSLHASCADSLTIDPFHCADGDRSFATLDSRPTLAARMAQLQRQVQELLVPIPRAEIFEPSALERPSESDADPKDQPSAERSNLASLFSLRRRRREIDERFARLIAQEMSVCEPVFERTMHGPLLDVMDELLSSESDVVGPATAASMQAVLGGVIRWLDDKEEEVQRAQRRERMVVRLSEALRSLHQGGSIHRRDLEPVVRLALDDARRDDAHLRELPFHEDPARRIAHHSLDVARLIARLTIAMPAVDRFQEDLVTAALLADVGMLELSPSEMNAPELTPESRDKIELHPIRSQVLMNRVIGLPAALSETVRQHHERLNGSGYPEGLSDQAIGLRSRLLAIADVYVALRSSRPHRPRHSPRQALLEALRAAELRLLDADLVKKLLNVGFYPVGEWVEMSSGEVAQVIAVPEAESCPKLASRPVVRVLERRPLASLAPPRVLNLAARLDLEIVRRLDLNEVALWFQRS